MMNRTQKIILSLTVPLVILAVAISIILSSFGSGMMCPMMGSTGIGGLGVSGIVLALTFGLIGLFEFWLFRTQAPIS